MNSYTYTDYHHHQFDRPLALPLPMPSPTSCWYPQPPPYAYNAESQLQQAYSPLCPQPRDPPDWKQRHQPLVHTGFHPPHAQPPDQLDWQQRYDPCTQPLPDLHHFDSYSQSPHGQMQYNQPPLEPRTTSQFQPPDPQHPDHLDWQLYYAQNFATSTSGQLQPDPAPPLESQPVQQPPDLEPNLSVAALVSQLERLTADVEQLVSRMDANERRLSDPQAATRPSPAPPLSPPFTTPVSCPLPQPTTAAPSDLHHDPSSSSQPAAPAVPPSPPQRSSSCWSSTSPTSHCSSAAPMPAAAAAPSFNLPPRAPPCSPDISGGEGELLDDDPLPPAVISQPGGPNTSPTLVPCSMKIEISEECGNNEKFYNHSHDRGWNRECIVYSHKGGKLIKVELDKSHPIDLKAREFEVFIVSRVKKLANDAIFAPKLRPCVFDPGGDTSKLLLSLTLFVASWFPP